MTESRERASRIIESPVGRLYISVSERGLTELLFVDETMSRPEPAEIGSAAACLLDATERQLGEYFDRARRRFDIPIAPSGTEFQLATWRALRTIPYGETISYSELARRVGKPRAVRAVGAANGANPISIVVPCHRVIGADGTLTGYGGGLHRKRWLLNLEKGTDLFSL
jgi:methylated-DNA-[protein]-cysteine S-methyltransferase